MAARGGAHRSFHAAVSCGDGNDAGSGAVLWSSGSLKSGLPGAAMCRAGVCVAGVCGPMPELVKDALARDALLLRALPDCVDK